MASPPCNLFPRHLFLLRPSPSLYRLHDLYQCADLRSLWKLHRADRSLQHHRRHILIFWLTVVALALRLLHPLLRLSPANFALVYAALMVAVVLPSMGFGGYFIPLIAGVFYYATPENNWSDLLWPHIPHWAVPRDLEAIRQLFEGADASAPGALGLGGPGRCCGWGLFMLAFFFVSIALIGLVHHQWSRQERLVYPLAAVPNMLLESLENPTASILKSKLLWLGFSHRLCAANRQHARSSIRHRDYPWLRHPRRPHRDPSIRA